MNFSFYDNGFLVGVGEGVDVEVGAEVAVGVETGVVAGLLVAATLTVLSLPNAVVSVVLYELLDLAILYIAKA